MARNGIEGHTDTQSNFPAETELKEQLKSELFLGTFKTEEAETKRRNVACKTSTEEAE